MSEAGKLNGMDHPPVCLQSAKSYRICDTNFKLFPTNVLSFKNADDFLTSLGCHLPLCENARNQICLRLLFSSTTICSSSSWKIDSKSNLFWWFDAATSSLMLGKWAKRGFCSRKCIPSSTLPTFLQLHWMSLTFGHFLLGCSVQNDFLHISFLMF